MYISDRDDIAYEDPQQGGLAVHQDGGTVASYAFVSAAHTVLPGEKLTIDLAGMFPLTPSNSMAYQEGVENQQARVDVYDASNPGFPGAASLKPAIFDPSSITAGPFLGNLLPALEITQSSVTFDWHTLTADLSPYVGKSVYFAYRQVVTEPSNESGLDNFTVVC